MTRLTDGLIADQGQARFLSTATSRPCAVGLGIDSNGVSRGICRPCYWAGPRFRVQVRTRIVCTSLLHPHVSTDTKPTACPMPGILPLLWPYGKAERQAALPMRQRELVCQACKTLAERQKRASRGCGRGSADDGRAVVSLPSRLDHPTADVGPVSGGAVADDTCTVSIVRNDTSMVSVPSAAPAAAASPTEERMLTCTPVASAVNVAPVTIAPTTNVALSTVMATYAAMDDAQRTAVGGIVSLHLAAVKPDAVRARFKNGRSLLYTRVPVPVRASVGPRQQRRRVVHAAAAVASLCAANETAFESMLRDLIRRAERRGVISVVPALAMDALPVRLQTQFVVANSISQALWARFRRLLGGSASRLSSREVLRADLRAAAAEPRNRVTSSETGVWLVSVRAAFQALVDDLVARGDFIERSVAGVDGGEVLAIFGLDKGGDTSTCKAVLACGNQAHPCSRDNTILFRVFPCKRDDYQALKKMSELFVGDLEDLRASGIRVAGANRAVRLILMGDYAFSSTFVGHAGPTCRMPCTSCSAFARPTLLNAGLLSTYGDMQKGSQAGDQLRTRDHAAQMVSAYEEGPLASQAAPLSMTEHKSIERSPLMVLDGADLAPMPLHLTLGGTVYVVGLGVEAVAFEHGPARAGQYAVALAKALQEEVGVTPAPYWGGTFEGKKCHVIGRKLTRLCDLLDQFVSQPRARAYRAACALWAKILPVLNRAVLYDASERAAFRRQTAAFVDGLKAGFEWCSVTPKLHILCCHAPEFLDRFGSIGLFSEQGLEAWHGYFNQNAQVFAAETFLGFCMRLVQRAAVSRGPGDAAFNLGKRRAPAAANARCATRAGDMRTTRARVAAGTATGQSAACVERASEDMAKWASDVHAAAVTKVAARRHRVGAAAGPAPLVAPDGDEEAGCLLDLAESACLAALLGE